MMNNGKLMENNGKLIFIPRTHIKLLLSCQFQTITILMHLASDTKLYFHMSSSATRKS